MRRKTLVDLFKCCLQVGNHQWMVSAHISFQVIVSADKVHANFTPTYALTSSSLIGSYPIMMSSTNESAGFLFPEWIDGF